MMDSSHRVRVIATILLVALVAGCGDSTNPFDTVPVSGKVVYDDGSPIPVQGMDLSFHSQTPPKEGLHPRVGAVGVKSDGTFENVTSHKYADGLALGKHKVVIISREAGKFTRKIPKECTEARTTPVEVEVTDSGQFLEIKVPKPKS
jgi:hypothetical protein